MSDEPSSCHYLIRGRVQGVGFRHFVWLRATELGIRGWVRNLKDGSVEVVAWGSDDSLKALIGHLGQGPRWSRVDAVVCDRALESEAPPGQFSIRS